jgi:hypothetical protein
MKTQLQKKLAKIAPSVCIKTVWSHDLSMHPDIRKDCDGFDDEDPDNWQCWRSEVIATTIQCGEAVSGSSHLGGTWQKAEDLPWITNPDISGYEAQMTKEALDNLLETVSIIKGDTRNQILDALDIIKNA